MKTKCKIELPRSLAKFGLGLAMLTTALSLLSWCTSAQAQLINLLANPGAETGNFNGWIPYNDEGYNFGVVTATQAPPHSGTYSFWIFGDYNSPTTYCGMYQFVPAHPGEVFYADGWEYQIPSDSFTTGDQNNAFLEVTFQDASGDTLARYRSAPVVAGSPTGVWQDLLVTNQYDPNTYAFIGTVTNLVAPANTVVAEMNVVFNLVNDAGGSTYWDDLSVLAQTPPPCYITNVTPLNVLLATNGALSFTVVGPGGNITNVQMTVTATSGLVNGTTTTTTYNTATSTNWATISGLNSANCTVSYPLATNTLYSITYKAVDVNQNIASGSSTFDTLSPVLVWEAEDFNFNGGEWITNITADGGTFAYSNVVGTASIDEQDASPGNGPHYYRDVSPPQVSIQGAYEQTAGGAPITRQKFINFYAANPAAAANENTVDEEVGYNNVGDWLDYTRNFPTGKYNVYARLATDGSGAQAYFQTVTSDPTQPNQTVVTNGTFSMNDNNWNVYQYVPLLDSYGNLVSVSLGGVQTVRVQIAPGGNPNENFYMLMPAQPPQNPLLQGAYPDGVHPFESTNHFTFTIGQGSGSSIPAGSIHLLLNGYDVTPQVAFTSTATNWTGTIPLVSNSVYTAVILATNSTHLTSTYSINFDTFSQSLYMWEAEDFDFNGGQFIDNPVPTGDSTINAGIATGEEETNSYYYQPGAGGSAISGVDFVFAAASGMEQEYRGVDPVGTQVAGDFLRQKFYNEQQVLNDPNIADFNIGWYSAGDWLNYTRDYPAGTYNIYGRMAGGAGPFSGTFLCEVTSGWGSSDQTTNVLGYFSDPNAAGWQTWHWVPMLDTNNNLVAVTFNGSTNTLKLVSGNNLNVNFLMLVPPATPPLPVNVSLVPAAGHFNVTFPTQPNHSYTVQYTASLAPPVTWTTLTVVEGDGTSKTVTDTAASAARFYRIKGQ